MKVVEKSCWFGKNELAQWHTHTHTHTHTQREREREREREVLLHTSHTHTQNRLSQHKKIYQMILMGLHSQFFSINKTLLSPTDWNLCVCVLWYFGVRYFLPSMYRFVPVYYEEKNLKNEYVLLFFYIDENIVYNLIEWCFWLKWLFDNKALPAYPGITTTLLICG